MHYKIPSKLLPKKGRTKLLIALFAVLVVAGGLSLTSFTSALPSSNNLVAHWSFDQSSGSTATDNSGNGHTGTLTGAPAWATGQLNNGLDFDGPDAVEVGDISEINNASQVTLAAWIKKTETYSAVLIGKQTTAQDVAIEAWYDGNLYFQLSNGSDTYGYMALDDTDWHHVALVFDGTQTGNANRLKAYVDGTQETLTFNGTVGTTTTSDTTPFNIGKIGPDYTYGMIDDVWLYNRALSQSEVQELRDIESGDDIAAPSTPQSLDATAVSSSQINLSWSAATDNVGVTGYRVYRNGTEIGTTTGTTYQNSGLSASTAYTYTVRAYDAAGNQSGHSASDSATTSAPDTTNPTVSITAPADEATISGATVAVSANASDNVGVAGVKFYAGSTQIGSEDTSSPYSVTWDTTGLTNGPFELTAVARDAANNSTTSTAITVNVNNAAAHNYVTGISSNGRFFVDQNDDPILIRGDSPWSMFSDLSPTQVEAWADNREGHGYNAAIVSLIGNPTNGGPHDSGATYDNIEPFVSGDVTDWNETYWDRMENYLTILKNHGITAFLYPIDGWTTLPDGAFDGVSNADAYTFGQMVAERFPAEDFPNIVWMVGGDYNGYDDTINGQMQNVISGIRSTSDTRILSGQWNSGTISTDVEEYEPKVQWNFAYAYSPIYHNLFRAYNRTAGVRDPRPVLFSESNYEGEGEWDGISSTNETFRRQEIWALTSGSPGSFNGSQDWKFMEDWEERLDSTVVTQSEKVRNYFENLTNWQLLVPDDTDPFVTAGRGTKDDAENYLDVLQNAYVTAAQTPDESLSTIYVPTNVGNTNARTITLDLDRLPSSYTATWVDPTDATSTQSATINGSGEVTTPGTHGDGTRDWLLVIKAQ